MANIREWLDKGHKSSARMTRLLPMLIRQARLETPLTYGDVARELGVHHRAVHHIAGYIGYTLSAVAERRGWTKRPPPPLHAMIVNDVTGLPGRGIDGFLSEMYQNAATKQEKLAVLKAVYSQARNYDRWAELCELLRIPLDGDALVDAVEKARRARGRGGEGPHHLALKTYVSEHPEAVGLAPGSRTGEVEWPTSSGDKVDVVFERRGLRLAVEVKPYHAVEGDLLRGVFQCLKYKAVLTAEAALADETVKIRVLLLLGGGATEEVVSVANRLGIPVHENVRFAGDRPAAGAAVPSRRSR